MLSTAEKPFDHNCPSTIRCGPPQLWISSSNGKFKPSCLNPHVEFLKQFCNADGFYGDHDFDMWVSRRPFSESNTSSDEQANDSATSACSDENSLQQQTYAAAESNHDEPSLLEWAVQLPDPSGWLQREIRSIQAEISSIHARRMQDPTKASIPSSTRHHSGDPEDGIHEPRRNANSLERIINRYGYGFDSFNDETADDDERKFLALKYLMQNEIPICSIPILELRIKHIEEVEFIEADEIDDGGVSMEKISRIYERLHQMVSEERPQQAVELLRMWFPLDEDQLHVRGNQHLDEEVIRISQSASVESSTGSPSIATSSGSTDDGSSLSSSASSSTCVSKVPGQGFPQIIQISHDGNFSMMLARTRKYNYLFAFATS